MQSRALPAKGLSRFLPKRSTAVSRDASATSKRNRWAFGIASVLTLAGSYFGLIKPENARLQEKRAQAEQAEATVAQLRSQLAHLKDLERQAADLQAQAVRLDEALPVETHLAKFILQIQDAANQAKLDWVSANPSPPAASGSAPGLMESSVTMTALGSYAAVQDFLARLENLARAVKISSVNLTREGEAVPGADSKLSLSINLKMFVAPTAPPLPSEQSPAPPAAADPAPSSAAPASAILAAPLSPARTG